MNTNQNFIELLRVNKSFASKHAHFIALKKINLSIKKEEFVVITGKSGSGKSTLLNMLSGIDTPSKGEIWINQMPIHQLKNNTLAKWRGKHVGIIFQFFQLMPTLSVIENVILPMEFAHMIPYTKQKDRAYTLLEKVGISKLAHKLPQTLSGGEKQRVAIARSLANNPDIIIADEPTGNLDSQNTQIIHQLFNQLSDEGKTIIYVTHEQNPQLKYHKSIHIVDGEIVNNEQVFIQQEV